MTPEQREKQKTEHESTMHQMQEDHRRPGMGMREGRGEMGRSPGGAPPAVPFKEKKEEPKQ